ncbi:MAG: hypothetical protein IKT46_05825 [Clostridia bacterium]|nr:hypothetical protein [Clostridia bacterium]
MNLISAMTLNKYIAIAIGISAVIYISYSIRKYARDKILFHCAVIDFITYTRQQIAFFCTPTARIIASYKDPILSSNGFFDKKGLENNRYLDQRGRKLLEEFFSRLGKSSSEEQTANCDYIIAGLNTLIDEYKNDAEKKYKAYSSLTLILGLMLLILLV